MRPNILWFSLEDTSPTFGCHGDPHARTPNLDRIAAEGCLYENAFAIAAVCAPSRNGVITGRYATANGAHHMRTGHGADRRLDPAAPFPYECVPPPHVKAFTEYLRAAGYFCSNNDKTDYQFGVPSSVWDSHSARAHWRQRAPGQPFFAVFNPTVTHESGHWPHDNETISVDPAKLTLPPFIPDTPETRLALARHYENLSRSDARLGQLLAELEADGLLETTIIFIWSDHGMGFPRHKRWPYDTGLRVPLIVRAPGLLAPGSRSSELVSLIDLGPTVLALAGVDRPSHLHGRVFFGPHRDAPRDHVFGARDRYDESFDKMRTVRDARYRYIRNAYPNLEREIFVPYRNRHPAMQEIWTRAAEDSLDGAQAWFAPVPRRAEELYDTHTDPWETNNLIDDPALRPVRDRLRAELDAWQARHDPWHDISEADMVRSWHPDGKQPATAAPVAIPLGRLHPGLAPLLPSPETALTGPVLLQLACGTEGASIEYQLFPYNRPPAPDAFWTLYAGPLRLPSGRHTLRARAIRYGYKPSLAAEWQFAITA